jgi:hypothetical protein
MQLGQGVLTATHLDYWYDQWDGSNSDSDFGSDIGEKETPNQLDDGDDQIPINSELDYKEDDAPAAAQFGVSENALKFLSLDMLDCNSTMDVTLLFERVNYETPLIDILEVLIRIFNPSESESPLPELTGDRTVSLIFQVFQDQSTLDSCYLVGHWH